MKPILNIVCNAAHYTPIKSSMQNKQSTIETALKNLLTQFQKINEIGKFQPIIVDLENPVKNSTIKKAKMVIEPTVSTNDYRTRILSFVAESPANEQTKNAMTLATGNKFSIESVLKNPKTKTAFKNFILESEKLFSEIY